MTRRSLRPLAGGLAGLVLAGLLGGVSAPAAAAAAGCAPLTPVLQGARSTVRTLAPGVVVRRWTLPRHRGMQPVVAHVVTADLQRPGVTADLLAGPVTSASTLPELVAGSGALVAVNGDFFSMAGRGAVYGAEVQRGRLRKGTRTASVVLGVGTDRRARLGHVALEGSLTSGSGATARRWPLASLNAEQQPVDGFAGYTSTWGPVPVPAPRGALQVVVRRDRVVALRRSDGLGLRVPADSVVVVARGAGARSLSGLRPGAHLSVRAAQRTSAPVQFRSAVGGGLLLVRRGAVQPLGCSVENETPRPRAAIGASTGGRYLVLLVVEGAPPWEPRGGRAPGLSVRDTGALLRTAGAVDGLMLDGGGSAQLVARPGGRGAPVSLSTLEDGDLRPVPNAFGIRLG